MPDFCIIIDTREQIPYTFESISQGITEKKTLKTGDYSLKGFEDIVCVERKTLSDAYGTFGKGRARFEKELERMMAYQYAAVVIEADWHTIIKAPPRRSRLNPKTVHASVITWQQRFGVHFWTCPNRQFAERTTFRILERFYRDITDDKKKRSKRSKD